MASNMSAQTLSVTLRSLFTPFGWMTLVCALVCLSLAAMCGWREMLAAGMLLAVLLPCCLMMSRKSSVPKIEFHVSAQRVRVGDCVDFKAALSNPETHDIPPAVLRIPICGQLRMFSIPRLRPGQQHLVGASVKADRRKVMRFGPPSIRKGDPFGLAGHAHRLGDAINVFVHPRIRPPESFPVMPAQSFEGDSAGRIVNDGSDFHALRPYARGDDVRRIHWLSSARTGTTLVRQYVASHHSVVSLSIGTEKAEYRSTDEFELAVSVYASLGAACLSQGHRLRTHAGAADERPDSVVALLDSCSALSLEHSGGIPTAGGFEQPPSPARHAATANPSAAMHLCVFGSRRSDQDLARAASWLPDGALHVIIRIAEGSDSGIAYKPNHILLTIGALDDLPRIWSVMS